MDYELWKVGSLNREYSGKLVCMVIRKISLLKYRNMNL